MKAPPIEATVAAVVRSSSHAQRTGAEGAHFDRDGAAGRVVGLGDHLHDLGADQVEAGKSSRLAQVASSRAIADGLVGGLVPERLAVWIEQGQAPGVGADHERQPAQGDLLIARPLAIGRGAGDDRQSAHGAERDGTERQERSPG